MPILKFTLTMPNKPVSRWTGQGCEYNHVKDIGRSKEAVEKAAALDGKFFRYNFGDGWVAQVNVQVVDAAQATKARRASQGFCGYDWMWASILKHGDIRCDSL